MKVLVVDDHPTFRDATVALLDRLGHHTSSATNGRLALKAIQASRPDVVIADIFMAEMDGIELILRLRETAPHLPVIAVASKDHPNRWMLKVADQLGAAGTLLKPFDCATLVAALARIVESNPHRSPVCGQAA